MMKLSLTGLGVTIGGLALSLAVGSGVAAATPDLGPAVDTTCSYPQLVSALRAQGPDVGAAFDQSPMLKMGLRQFLAAGPAQRQKTATEMANAPAFAPYLGTIEQAFLTCNNF
jgi:hemophore-related protein